jgi:type I restriction enzyme S subunit
LGLSTRNSYAALEESRTLTQTRDLLLPKLMSGEIRLKDAGKMAEALL